MDRHIHSEGQAGGVAAVVNVDDAAAHRLRVVRIDHPKLVILRRAGRRQLLQRDDAALFFAVPGD